MRLLKTLTAAALVLGAAATAQADGIVGSIVNAPLSATGTVKDARVGINVYLQKPEAPGMDFMDPAVLGYGIPPGGRLEIEMAEGFERDWDVGLSQAAIMMVTGAPQQGLPGKAVGYQVTEGEEDTVFVITPTAEAGLPAEALASPAPGAKQDPILQRGIKVVHIGFQQSAFFNRGARGRVAVRILDAAGKAVQEGSGTIAFIDSPVAQVLPTNFPQGRRNHNWQRVKPGETLGQTEGALSLTFMLYDKAPAGDAAALYSFKAGIAGVGVLSTQQVKAMGFALPEGLSRYNGGLVVRDSNGDAKLDPGNDQIIGGVIGAAPEGARGQELRSLEKDGKVLLSQMTAEMAPKPGERWGGAMLLLQFTAGDKAGKYRPTVALLERPGDPTSPDGSSYTYTIVAE